MATPYITPAMLTNAPTGASWDIIPSPTADAQANLAELTNVCWRATSYMDTYVNQVLRSTCDTEYLTGPGEPRCNVDPATGLGVLQMRRWPITEVLAMQISAAQSFPRAWSPVSAGQWDIRHPLIFSGDSASATAPDGGWTIDVACGVITWCYGRRGQRVQVCYFNGWPHTSLTAAVGTTGETVLDVDDVTGWVGASGFIYDGADTEVVSVVSVEATSPFVLPNGAGTAQAGPGQVTLATGTTFTHAEGVVVSAMPANLTLAAVWAAAGQALEAGIDGVVIQQIAGEHVSSGGGGTALFTEAELLLDAYKRVI